MGTQLSVRAFAFAFSIVWGGAVMMVTILNLIQPAYGHAFLSGLSSIYPGYDGASSLLSAITGSCYAFVDGAIGGLFFAWVYNLFIKK